MRIASLGHAVFAIILVGLGVVGLFHADLVPLWSAVPAGIPARTPLIDLGLLISIGCGLGLLFLRTAVVAARLLLATLLLWLLLFRVPDFFHGSAFGACWSVFPLALMLAAAWVLYVWFANDWDGRHLSLIIGQKGLCAARSLYGLCLIFFGLAHFIDVKDTLSLIPHWLPGNLFWAYLFGCTFIAAGLAILFGLWARLAAALAAFQIGLFLFLVWIPIVAGGSKATFVWSETILNAALLAGAWVMSDSYRGAHAPVRSGTG